MKSRNQVRRCRARLAWRLNLGFSAKTLVCGEGGRLRGGGGLGGGGWSASRVAADLLVHDLGEQLYRALAYDLGEGRQLLVQVLGRDLEPSSEKLCPHRRQLRVAAARARTHASRQRMRAPNRVTSNLYDSMKRSHLMALPDSSPSSRDAKAAIADESVLLTNFGVSASLDI